MEQDELELMDGRTILGYPKDKLEQRNWEFFLLADADNHIQIGGKTAAIMDYSNGELRMMQERDGNTTDYQKERSRVRKEKIAAIRERNRFIHDTLSDILEGEPIDLSEVEKFFSRENGE